MPISEPVSPKLGTPGQRIGGVDADNCNRHSKRNAGFRSRNLMASVQIIGGVKETGLSRKKIRSVQSRKLGLSIQEIGSVDTRNWICRYRKSCQPVQNNGKTSQNFSASWCPEIRCGRRGKGYFKTGMCMNQKEIRILQRKSPGTSEQKFRCTKTEKWVLSSINLDASKSESLATQTLPHRTSLGHDHDVFECTVIRIYTTARIF